MMRGFDDLLMLQQLLQPMGSATVLFAAVYLAGMFAALVWRRESIVSWGLFRVSYFLFGASLIAPAIAGPIISLSLSANNRFVASDANVLLRIVHGGLGPLLFAGAVVCGLAAMMPRRVFAVAPPAPKAEKHPLD